MHKPPLEPQRAIVPDQVRVEQKGLTWGTVLLDGDMVVVGCHGKPRLDGTDRGPSCNPYHGDTSCSAARPILCLKPEGLPRPNYAVPPGGAAMPAEYYHGWAGGIVGLTEPVRGEELTSVQKANDMCESALGDGYRMAEHHDGKYVDGMTLHVHYGDAWPGQEQLLSGGWSWRAYGNVARHERFWVHINDQRGNCWNSAEPPDRLRDVEDLRDALRGCVWQPSAGTSGRSVCPADQ